MPAGKEHKFHIQMISFKNKVIMVTEDRVLYIYTYLMDFTQNFIFITSYYIYFKLLIILFSV